MSKKVKYSSGSDSVKGNKQAVLHMDSFTYRVLI